MADVITIPLTTLPVGETDTPSISIADADTMVTVRIDRTVAGGFNSVPSGTWMWMSPFQSNDGGATWFALDSGAVNGGIYTDRGTGLTATYSSVEMGLAPGTGRKVMAKLMVSGSSVAVSGTVTAS